MRPRRSVRTVAHPEPMMRFRPDEWPGSPLEAYLSWRGAFDLHWREQKAAGRVVLPEAVHACFVDKHLGWRFKAKSEGRRLVRAVSGGE